MQRPRRVHCHLESQIYITVIPSFWFRDPCSGFKLMKTVHSYFQIALVTDNSDNNISKIKKKQLNLGSMKELGYVMM